MDSSTPWKDRGHALVLAIRDVAPPSHPRSDMPGMAAHDALFTHFVEALTQAKEEADSWWTNLVDVEATRSANRAEATARVRERHPGGPVTYGTVTYVVRRYWFECIALNRQGQGDADRLAPEELIMAWLMRSAHQDLARFLSALPFWPLGLDVKGQWI